MTADPDRTFNEVSLYGSVEWTATAMGLTKDRFFRKRAKWQKDHGFPAPDPINKLYIKADVLAWVTKRRVIADSVIVEGSNDSQEVNFDEL